MSERIDPICFTPFVVKKFSLISFDVSKATESQRKQLRRKIHGGRQRSYRNIHEPWYYIKGEIDPSTRLDKHVLGIDDKTNSVLATDEGIERIRHRIRRLPSIKMNIGPSFYQIDWHSTMDQFED